MNSAIIESLRPLSEDVLDEVIREGELNLRAQFDAASNFDSRAMTWLRMLVSLAVAATAASIGIQLSDGPKSLVLLGILFSILNVISAAVVIRCVAPSKSKFPGNRPSNWFPQDWLQSGKTDLFSAKLEQAHCIETSIEANETWAAERAKWLRFSMNFSVGSVTLLMLGGLIIAFSS